MTKSLEWKKITENQRKIILDFHDSYPIAVGKLAKSFGIVLKKATLEGNLAGEIKEVDGIVTIRVNSHDVKVRQRYTIAHEIAHFLLHRKFLSDGIQDTPLYRSHLSNQIEREADALAADILMPMEIVQALMDENSKEYKGERLYEVVAENLEVSKTALRSDLVLSEKLMIDKAYNYLPILSISTAEMSALEKLPDKDKNLLLPIFPLKGWVGSKTLDKTISRIGVSIGSRPWIADIDSDFVFNNKKYLADPDSQREVFKEVHELLDPTNGYENWVQYITELDNVVIPTLQTYDVEQIGKQIKSLSDLARGLVVRLKIKKDPTDRINSILRSLIENKVNDLLILLDFEDIMRSDVLQSEQYGMLVSRLSKLLPNAIFATSASSFPSSFSGSYRGELPIYERQLHTAVCKLCEGVRVIYSDRGSARANKTNGGGGIPPARIDYPLRNDWRYVRKEFRDPSNVTELEKHTLYKEAATEIVESDYWNPSLRLWGVQMIEKTVEFRDEYCITSANRATAVRINIHLYQQLHYLSDFGVLDTEEDWED